MEVSQDKELLFRIAKKYIPFAVLAVLCIAVAWSLYLFLAPREVKKYTAQPITFSFPLCYDASLMPKTPKESDGFGKWSSWTTYANDAANGLNSQIKKAAGKGPIWVPRTSICTKDQTFFLVPASAEEKKFPQGRCQPIPWRPLGSETMIAEKTMAWIDPVKRQIVLCVDKFKQAYSIRYQNNSIARYVRMAGGNKTDARAAYIRHEMAHALLTEHLYWGCKLMCPSPAGGELSEQALRIIRAHIIPKVVFK